MMGVTLVAAAIFAAVQQAAKDPLLIFVSITGALMTAIAFIANYPNAQSGNEQRLQTIAVNTIWASTVAYFVGLGPVNKGQYHHAWFLIVPGTLLILMFVAYYRRRPSRARVSPSP